MIGRSETAAFLKDKPLRILWGVGLSTQGALEQAGIRSVSDILDWELRDLTDRFGQTGERLWHLARGIDTRTISPHDQTKSISKETTFDQDLTDIELLFSHLWRLTEQVADRAKARELEGKTVTVKVKQADHRILTRRRSLREPAQHADTIWRTAEALLRELAPRAPFRLLGVGLSELSPASGRDPAGDLLDPGAARRAAAERSTDAIRAKFGADAIIMGRTLR